MPTNLRGSDNFDSESRYDLIDAGTLSVLNTYTFANPFAGSQVLCVLEFQTPVGVTGAGEWYSYPFNAIDHASGQGYGASVGMKNGTSEIVVTTANTGVISLRRFHGGAQPYDSIEIRTSAVARIHVYRIGA